MVGSRAEKAQSSSVGKNWVTMGFCSKQNPVRTLRTTHIVQEVCQLDSERVGSYVEVLHWFGHVKLVHGGNNDGRCGEEEEQDEQDAVDDEATYPPGDPT